LLNGFKATSRAAKLFGMVVNPAAYDIIRGKTIGRVDCFRSPHTGSWT
jgi:hypothetical protein